MAFFIQISSKCIYHENMQYPSPMSFIIEYLLFCLHSDLIFSHFTYVSAAKEIVVNIEMVRLQIFVMKMQIKIIWNTDYQIRMYVTFKMLSIFLFHYWFLRSLTS